MPLDAAYRRILSRAGTKSTKSHNTLLSTDLSRPIQLLNTGSVSFQWLLKQQKTNASLGNVKLSRLGRAPTVKTESCG